MECCPLHDGVVGRTRRIEFNPGSLGRRRRTRPGAVARGDLLLTVESHLLTLTRPDSYDISAGVDLWFLGVKFAHNLSVLGLRQVIPLLLLAAQWLH